MAQYGPACHHPRVSGDFGVVSVTQIAANRLRAITRVAGYGVDASDPTDCLSPSCWSLSASGVQIAMIESATPDVDHATEWLLDLDSDLAIGACSLGLSSSAVSRYGQPTDTTTVAFAASPTLPVVDATIGARGSDVALPLASDETGDVALWGKVESLHAWVERMVTTSLGEFRGLDDFGRTVQPKRTYSQGQLLAEAARLKSAILQHPDVKTAEISPTVGRNYARLDVRVVPKTGTPIRVERTVTAGVT